MLYETREHSEDDLNGFVTNAYSNMGMIEALFTDSSIEKRTLLRDGKAVAFILFRPYWPHHYNAAFVIGDGFTARDGAHLKAAMDGLISDGGALRVETESVASEIMDRWHEYLGFTLCGRKHKFLNGMDYNIWEWLKDGG